MRSVPGVSILADTQVAKISIKDVVEANALEHILDVFIVTIENCMVSKCQ